MGNFGTLDGHVDCLDCVGCLTTMMAMSRLPEGYEAGRFHLLSLGVYTWLDFMKILVFCGLNKHGGTPPIAPPGQLIVDPHATRMMGVMYPPESMINGSGSVKTILASLGKGYLELPPEVTGYVLVFSITFQNKRLHLFIGPSRNASLLMKQTGPLMAKASWKTFLCSDMSPGVCCNSPHMFSCNYLDDFKS